MELVAHLLCSCAAGMSDVEQSIAAVTRNSADLELHSQDARSP